MVFQKCFSIGRLAQGSRVDIVGECADMPDCGWIKAGSMNDG